MNSAKAFRRVTVSTKDVIAPFFILLTLNVIFLSVWTGVDPMHWVREDLSNDGLSSHGLCKLGETGVSIAMLSCLLTLNFCLVVLAIYQLYRARDIPSEFSEEIHTAVQDNMQAFTVLLPNADNVGGGALKVAHAKHAGNSFDIPLETKIIHYDDAPHLIKKVEDICPSLQTS